jgi:DNA modification methylase
MSKAKPQPPAPVPQPLAVEWWPIDRPKPYGKNPRLPSAKAGGKVAASIKEFGWRQPIVVDAHGVIVAGHKRMEAARSLGLAQVPVHVAASLTPAQCKQYRLMDNRSQDDSEWDLELLACEIGELAAMENVELALTGFDPEEIKQYTFSAQTEGLAPEDEAPEPPTAPVSVLGDLWLLGKHRVLCGDATEVTALDRLCEDICSCVWTDPPYGVKYVGKTPDALRICGDEPAGVAAMLHDALTIATRHLQPGAPFYIASPAGGEMSLVFATAVQLAGWRTHQVLVWLKDSMVLGHSDYHYRHEPILYGYTPGPGRPGRGNHEGSHWYGSHSETSVLEFPHPKCSDKHPTVKPVELIVRCLANSSKSSEAVLDLFGGSGSTLIACETTARACRMMELAPAYVDVIVQRWQKFTGQAATLEGDGRAFDAVATERAALTQASPAARTRFFGVGMRCQSSGSSATVPRL